MHAATSDSYFDSRFGVERSGAACYVEVGGFEEEQWMSMSEFSGGWVDYL
jgi:hypothetical protein